MLQVSGRVGEKKKKKKKVLCFNLKVPYSNITFEHKIPGKNVKLDAEYDIWPDTRNENSRMSGGNIKTSDQPQEIRLKFKMFPVVCVFLDDNSKFYH